MDETLQYPILTDQEGISLDGAKCYKYRLSGNRPASKFWSIIVYDSLTQLIIATDQPWPSVHSNASELIENEGGSVDAWFGPHAPIGKEHNWIKTIPGKNWYMILRLYGISDSALENVWKPGMIEELKYELISEKRVRSNEMII